MAFPTTAELLANQVRIDASPRWVRVQFAGETLGDSKRVKVLYEPGKLPVYYFPEEDVKMELLAANGSLDSEHLGHGTRFDLQADDRVAAQAAWRYEGEDGDLAGHIAFQWDAMDAWFEEDDQIFVHARDPFKRVDVLRSSRHVRVVLGGETIADTQRPSLLFETNLPVRYYVPRMDVRMELLAPSDTQTRCPYKGVAAYWSAHVNGHMYDDIVWTYPVPIPECPKIEQLLCFFNERVDAIFVDGELQEKPVTKWSR